MATKMKKGYTRQQRRAIKEKKQLKTNDKIAKATFIPSLIFFLVVVICLLVPFIIGFVQGLSEGSVTLENMGNGIMPAVMPLTTPESEEAAGIMLLILLLWVVMVAFIIVMGSFICPFILALGLRRGEGEERTKKGWIIAYAVLMICTWGLLLLGVLASGDILSGLVLLCVCGGFDSLLMVLAHKAGLFEAKKAKLRRKEDGKLHGGVFFIYLITKVGLYLSELTMGVAYFAALGLCLVMIAVAALKRLPYRTEKEPMVYSPYATERK